MDNSIFNKRNIRIAVVVITDIIMTALASGLAVLSRWDFSFANVPLKYLELWHRVLPIQIIITIVVYALFKMYRFVWRQISAGDVMEIQELSTEVAEAICSRLQKRVNVKVEEKKAAEAIQESGTGSEG